MNEKTETLEIMIRAREKLQDSIRVEAELQREIESQRAKIEVALGYIRAGRVDLAGLVLGGYNRPDECPKCVGEVAP